MLLPEKNKNKRTQTIKHIVKNNNNDYLYESIASNLAVDEDGAADTDAAASAAADDVDADADADAEEDDADDAAANHDDDHHRLVRKAAIKNTTIWGWTANLIAKNGPEKRGTSLNRFIDVQKNTFFVATSLDQGIHDVNPYSLPEEKIKIPLTDKILNNHLGWC